MYCILKTLLIGLVVALVNANPTKKIDGLAKALEQRSSKDPPPFNPDPDADYHGPERPAPKDSQSEYWNCIVKFVYNQVIRRHRYRRDMSMEYRALTETEKHCYEKSLRKWGVGPRRVPDYVIEEQIQTLESYRELILRDEEHRLRGNGSGKEGGRSKQDPNPNSSKDGPKAKIMGMLRAARDRFRSLFTRLSSASNDRAWPLRGTSTTGPTPSGNLGGPRGAAFVRPQFVHRF